MPLLRNRGYEKRRSLLNVLIVRYYVLEMACPIGLDCKLFLRSRTICRKVLMKIRQNVSLDTNVLHIERCAGSGDRVYTCRMVYKVGSKYALFYLLFAEVSGKLINYRTYHFDVCKLFCTRMISIS